MDMSLQMTRLRFFLALLLTCSVAVGCLGLTEEESQRVETIIGRQAEIKEVLEMLATGKMLPSEIDLVALNKEWDLLTGELTVLKEKSEAGWGEIGLLGLIFAIGNRVPYVGPYLKPAVKILYKMFARGVVGPKKPVALKDPDKPDSF